MEFTPNQIIEDGRPNAELVDEVQLNGSDLGHPFLLVYISISLVEEEDKLDIRELVSLRLGEGTVHHRRREAFVETADPANPFDHGSLLKHLLSTLPGAISACYLSIVEILIAQQLARPEDGFGLQQAVLEEVAASSRGPTTLLWTSSRYIGATYPETRMPNFGDAVRLAGEAGFPVLIRNSGGGAVAANEGSISFSLTFPVEDLRHGLYERYAEGAELIVATLAKLGIVAEAGEVEGEFCPGAYSIRSGGYYGIKVAGLAQRVIRRAARVEALVLITKTAELRRTLERFYGALGLSFRPESVADLPETDVHAAIEALMEVVRERYGAKEAELDEDILLRARSLRDRWRPTPGPYGPASSNP